jgi:hypothetical protein
VERFCIKVLDLRAPAPDRQHLVEAMLAGCLVLCDQHPVFGAMIVSKFAMSLLHSKETATTKRIARMIQKGAEVFSCAELIPRWIEIDVKLFLDALDVPSRSTITLRGGPRFSARYSAGADTSDPTYQQVILMGRVTVSLDKRFSTDSKSLDRLYAHLQPIDDLVYAVADAMRTTEAKVSLAWLGSWQPDPRFASNVSVRLKSELVVYQGKVLLKAQKSGVVPVQEWSPKG